ncbi:chemotaxis protein CheW [Maritalea porphyrae]|uniref:Chemotaxis protein CheW n=1 Tax=Maritalea porphyrae TaxID=880732 RepID=A0ABQ5ULV3_9HYPH|nr:chemotaxis protein CheW [Maritalea porphyrae]GLQ16189.1 chemotaxis protein CheW [Maritalea porphyrae]
MDDQPQSTNMIQLVTLRIGGQLFAINLELVDDVFKPEQFTPIPSVRPEIAGILNLRGRIIVAINTDLLLGLPPVDAPIVGRQMVNIKYLNESYGLLADSVGDVVAFCATEIKPNPINLDGNLAIYSQGILRLNGELMTVLMADKIIAQVLNQEAA